jgi:hypothetical protein
MLDQDPNTKERELTFHAADARAFSDALKDKFPAIRFVSSSLTPVSGDKDTGATETLRVPYLSGLGEANSEHCIVWLEPADWQPTWGRPAASGFSDAFLLTNLPRPYIRYDVGWRGDPDSRPIGDGRIVAYYRREDREHVAFLRKVWGLLGKLSTNVVDIVYDDTGRVRDHASHTTIWCGKRALEWCSERPERRLRHNIRPVGAPAAAPLPYAERDAAGCEDFNAGVDRVALAWRGLKAAIENQKQSRLAAQPTVHPAKRRARKLASGKAPKAG